jgi:calcineurin-like phosphoesterase
MSGVIIEVDTNTGLATKIEPLRIIDHDLSIADESV